MSLNKYMHPRNPFYNNPPDFDSLSKSYPEFSKHCLKTDDNKRLTIDFKNDESLRALCCTLLKSLFDLNIDLPLNHLIPRVPQRINYALWIEDLLERPLKAVGIDIGCGASCIFALIICSMNKQWKMIVSDIDDESIEFANKNVSQNNLQTRISTLKVNKVSSEDKILIDLLSKIDNEESIDFVMCNPPFFRNESELAGMSDKIRKPLKRPAPHSTNPMQPNESIFDDGEVGFVKRIIDESKIIEKRIRVYTSMLGKKESLLELKNYLRHSNILNVTETQFCQGRTMRWAIAWSFHDFKLPNLSYFIPKDSNKRSKPLSYEINIDQIGKESYTYEFLYEYIKKIFLDDLNFLSKESKSNSKLGFIVSKKTWSNQRAKRRKQQFQQLEINDDSNETLSFEFEFSLIKSPSSSFIIELDVDCSSDNLEMGEKREYLNQILQFLKNKLLNMNK